MPVLQPAAGGCAYSSQQGPRRLRPETAPCRTTLAIMEVTQENAFNSLGTEDRCPVEAYLAAIAYIFSINRHIHKKTILYPQ